MQTQLRSVAGLLSMLLVGTACSSVQDGPSAIDARAGSLSLAVGDLNGDFTLRPGVVNACAFFGGEAPGEAPGKGTFVASAPAGENVIAGNFEIAPGFNCIEIWNASRDHVVPVSASLVASQPGWELDRIVVASGDGLMDPPAQNLTGTNTGTVNVSSTIGGYIWFKFRKVALPPQGGQGCTPGYWKQSHHFDSWTGYSPTQAFGSVFANAFPGKTLAQVAALGGGGINALGRHSVAALLNASSAGVSFDLTTQQVIDGFNAAYASGNRRLIEERKNAFNMLNEQGCPLN